MVHAAGSDTLKVGLVGCGGRGTGAAEQALTADKNAKLVAMADAFQDRLEVEPLDPQGRRAVGRPGRRAQGPPVHRLRRLQERHRPGRRGPPDHPAPLPADPPGLRGREGRPRVRREAGGHRRARASARSSQACEDAKKKNLSLVSGLCWRYYEPAPRDHEAGPRRRDRRHRRRSRRPTTRGASGSPRKTREQVGRTWSTRCATGTTTPGSAATTSSSRPSTASTRWPGPWATSRRSSAGASAAARSRTDPKYGNIYDHFSIVYEYPDDVRGYHHCRHWANTRPAGQGLHPRQPRGRATSSATRSPAPNKWRYRPGREAARHVPGRARRAVRRDPRRQADQQRRVGRQQHPAGDHGPDGRLHRRGHHPGPGPELQARPEPRQVRVRPQPRARRCPCRGRRSSSDQWLGVASGEWRVFVESGILPF